jgi:hypothetical protein
MTILYLIVLLLTKMTPYVYGYTGNVLIQCCVVLQVCAEIRPGLQKRLVEEYTSDTSFTSTWDELQREARCCGVVGPRDFLALVPTGTNHTSILPPVGPGGGQWWWWRVKDGDLTIVPESCCRTLPQHDSARTTVSPSTPSSIRRINDSTSSSNRDDSSLSKCEVFPVGCEEHLLNWLRRSADILFVIGYCVVAFIKLCFLGILRYEIREMIQKIKLMQVESDDIAAAELTLTTHGSPTASSVTPLHMNHVGPPDRAPLLQRCNDCHPPILCSPPVLSKLGNHTGHQNLLNPHRATLGNGPPSLQIANDGNDSDTNSHCALIVIDKAGANGNNNELHELQEMRLMARQTQI